MAQTLLIFLSMEEEEERKKKKRKKTISEGRPQSISLCGCTVK
jgi:hypothetical protein